MSKIAKIIVGALALLVILIIVFVSGVSKRDVVYKNKETIKIGYIAPLSGNLAFLGQGMKNAAELALQDLKKKDTKYNYEIVFEDDAFTAAKSASAANKLISIDKVDALVTVASAAGGTVNPIAEKAQVVHLATASDPAIAKGQYNFINWTPPAEEVKVFIAELKKKNIKKVSLFGQTISGITAVIDEFKKQIVGTDIQIVSEDISHFGDKDFRTSIQKAKSANPDYIVLFMFSPELEIMTKQIRDAGIKTPLTSIEAFELSDKPAIFEGLWYVNATDPTTEFVKEYTGVYKTNPTIATPNAYDMVGLVAAAAEQFDGKKKPTGAELAEALTKVKGYNGALGNDIFMGADHIAVTKAVLRMIKDGKPVTIGQ